MFTIVALALTVFGADAAPASVTGDQPSQVHLLPQSLEDQQLALKLKIAALDAELDSFNTSWPRGAIILLLTGLGVGVAGFAVTMIFGVLTGLIGAGVLGWLLPVSVLPGIAMMIASAFWGVPIADAARRRQFELTHERDLAQARLNSIGIPVAPPGALEPQVMLLRF